MNDDDLYFKMNFINGNEYEQVTCCMHTGIHCSDVKKKLDQRLQQMSSSA